MSLRHSTRFLATLWLVSSAASAGLAQTPSAAAADTNRMRHQPRDGRLRIEMGDLQAVTIAPEFRYVGGRRFMLNATIVAEQHLFVVADSSRAVQRLLWVQVETRGPTDSGTYRYPSDSLRTVAGLPLRVAARAYASPPEPTSDRGSAYRIVEAAGYRMPGNATRLRLIYLPEEPARREVMIIHVEPADSTAPQSAALDALLLRALTGFHLEARH